MKSFMNLFAVPTKTWKAIKMFIKDFLTWILCIYVYYPVSTFLLRVDLQAL